MSSPAKIWFITGASSGFGRAMTERVLKQGSKVVATCREPESIADITAQYSSAQLLALSIDVTSKASIEAAFARAQQVFGRIDVVFNNVGYTVIGELEGTSDKVARDLFDTNYWGAVDVSKEAVKFFREVNNPVGGSLLQVSSLAGIWGTPGFGQYSASKFALEGFTEAFSREVDPKWNIKMTIIEPPFPSDKLYSHSEVEPVHPAYTDKSLESWRQRSQAETGTTEGKGDILGATAVIERLVYMDKPPLRLPLHPSTILKVMANVQSSIFELEQYGTWSDDMFYDV